MVMVYKLRIYSYNCCKNQTILKYIDTLLSYQQFRFEILFGIPVSILNWKPVALGHDCIVLQTNCKSILHQFFIKKHTAKIIDDISSIINLLLSTESQLTHTVFGI